MLDLQIFRKVLFSKAWNKSEASAALFNEQNSIFSKIYFGSLGNRYILGQYLNAIPYRMFCKIQSNLNLTWETEDEICFASKTMVFNLTNLYEQRWIPSRFGSNCSSNLYKTWCSTKLEVLPQWSALDGLKHMSGRYFLNKTEVNESLDIFMPRFRGIFSKEQMLYALDASSEQNFCYLYNISVSTTRGAYCDFNKYMMFGDRQNHTTSFLRNKQRKKTCAQMIPSLDVICSVKRSI